MTLTFDDFVGRVASELGIDVANPARDTSLRDDLMFDSIAVFEFVLVLEELCGVLMPEALLSTIDTLGEAFGWYEVRVGSA